MNKQTKCRFWICLVAASSLRDGDGHPRLDRGQAALDAATLRYIIAPLSMNCFAANEWNKLGGVQ